MAIVDEHGYEGMGVAAVAARAGVSRNAVYNYFGDRRECFLATFEALMDEGLAVVTKAYADRRGPWSIRLRQALDTLFAALVAQPAAARLCFLETYATGAPGAELRDRGVAELEALIRDALEESPQRAGMPQAIVSAMAGGIRIVTQTRLRRRQEQDLPDLASGLMGWLSTYETPYPPLSGESATAVEGPRFVATSHRDRLFVALAKVVYAKGYARTNVFDIATEAGVSLSTFYENFESKEAAFLAGCDFGIEQAFKAVSHAWEREAERGWPMQVRAGMSELLSFLAAEPAWAYMAMVEIFAAGPRARARRDRTIELFAGLVEPGRDLAPSLDPVAVEAIGGAIYSLMYSQIRTHGAARLPDLLPTTVFVVLAPFIGNAEALEVASGQGAPEPPLDASRAPTR